MTKRKSNPHVWNNVWFLEKTWLVSCTTKAYAISKGVQHCYLLAHLAVQNSGMCLSITVSLCTSPWALDRWEGRFLKVSLCARQPFLLDISFVFLKQCLCSISLAGAWDHCCRFYQESCFIGQIPKIMSSAGTEITLFLNGILEAAWWTLGPYCKVSGLLTVGVDFYHSFRFFLWNASAHAVIWEGFASPQRLQWGLSCDVMERFNPTSPSGWLPFLTHLITRFLLWA